MISADGPIARLFRRRPARSLAGTTAVIFYFSGTGNTWWCAERLAQSLKDRRVSARALSIEADDPAAVSAAVQSADLVGLGWPVYGSDLPEPMKRFIDSVLPDGGGRSLFTFCTQLLFSGNGARVYEQELAARGWKIRWSAHLRMPNNISVAYSPFRYSSDPADHARTLARTGCKLDRFAAAICSDRRFAQGRGLGPALLGALQRKPYRRWFPSLRDDVSVDPDVCTLCGRCVEFCPSGNLVVQDGRVATLGICVLCVRCYNFCPVHAVRYRGRRHDPSHGLPYRGPVSRFSPAIVIGPRR